MNKKELAAYKDLNDMHHDLIVAMQAALIAASTEGSDAGIRWIFNTLNGPGLVPTTDDPYVDNAQFYHSANISERNRLPACACGNPSHIGWMGQGFCCDEHHSAAKAKAAH